MSYSGKLRAEELVREKDRIENERSQIEGWLAHMRISPDPLEDRPAPREPRRLFWRDWGQRDEQPTPVPRDVSAAFYEFLIDRRNAHYARFREIQDELANAWKG